MRMAAMAAAMLSGLSVADCIASPAA